MKKHELKALLLRKTGSDDIVPGYNYTVMAIKTRSPWSFRDRLREAKDAIEKQAGVEFLPLLCLCRDRSVLVPVPFDASLNEVSRAILDNVKNVDFQVPVFG